MPTKDEKAKKRRENRKRKEQLNQVEAAVVVSMPVLSAHQDRVYKRP